MCIIEYPGSKKRTKPEKDSCGAAAGYCSLIRRLVFKHTAGYTVNCVVFSRGLFDPDYHFSALQCVAGSVGSLSLSKQLLFALVQSLLASRQMRKANDSTCCLPHRRCRSSIIVG